jgi:ABC-type Fe3+/spermidine/putrescine transport system ATPase subunit
MVLGDRIAVMAQGRIEQLGTPEQIYHDSRTAFVAGFVGLANMFDASVIGEAAAGLLRVSVSGLGELLARPGQGTAGRGAGQIFIRPESIRFGPGENALRGRVIRRTFLGATTDFLVEVGGRQLRIIASSDATDLPGGDEVVVSVRPDRCLFLAS